MEMISTARYKYYHKQWTSVIDYHNALAQAAYPFVSSGKTIDHPVLKENSSGRTALLAIGSTRGFCGSYNTAVYRLVEIMSNVANAAGKTMDIYTPDRKLVGILEHHGIKPAKIYKDFGEVPTESQISEVADGFIDEYIAGRIDYFGIVYTRFFSATSQQAQILAVLPLADLIDDMATRTTVLWPWETTLEDFYLSPSASEVIDGLSHMIVRSAVRSSFVEAALSEHLARMMAMRTATDNAETAIKDLTIDYNRARQSQITGELLDIIGGTGDLG